MALDLTAVTADIQKIVDAAVAPKDILIAQLQATIAQLQGQQPPPPPPPPPPTGWPTAANTGVPAGTALTAHQGNMTLSAPAAVLSGVDIKGTVTITANNVTLQRCKVTAAAQFVVKIAKGVTGTIVQDCEINGVGAGNNGSNGITGAGKFLRNNIYNVENGITTDADNGLVQDNYIHGLKASNASNGDVPHYDGIQCDGGVNGWIIRHNTIVNRNGQTSAVMIDNYYGAASNIVVDGNLLVGGGYTVYCDAHFNSTALSNISFTNNHMGAGQYGITDFNGTSPVYTGNVNDGAALAASLGV